MDFLFNVCWKNKKNIGGDKWPFLLLDVIIFSWSRFYGFSDVIYNMHGGFSFVLLSLSVCVYCLIYIICWELGLIFLVNLFFWNYILLVDWFHLLYVGIWFI